MSSNLRRSARIAAKAAAKQAVLDSYELYNKRGQQALDMYRKSDFGYDTLCWNQLLLPFTKKWAAHLEAADSKMRNSNEWRSAMCMLNLHIFFANAELHHKQAFRKQALRN